MIQDDPAIIEPIFKELKKNFMSGQTLDIEFRRQQLKNLVRGLNEMLPDMHAALDSDLGYKSIGVTNLFAISPVVKGIEHCISSLNSNAKPQNYKTNIIIGNGSSKVIPEPFGTALVIGSWNYPLFTALAPAAEAISAGNCVCMKPSELAPKSSAALKKLFEKYLDSRFYRVIEGAIEVAKKISTYRWDLIIFTGSPQKGKLVAKAAAENLVPCILELGGKSPTIIDKDANINNAAVRIALGKYANAGQTCLAPDYVLIDESVVDKFVKQMKETIKEFYSETPSKSVDYSRVVTEFHTQRLIDMIGEVKDQVVYGGHGVKEDRYIEPTLVLNPKLDSQLMQEEIFGPILPIITFKDFQRDVVDFVNEREKPLALYYFGANKDRQKVLEKYTSSGAVVFNDCVIHTINNEIPFGGVGHSGMSNLHGKWGFNSCSHMKPILNKDTYNGWPMNIRFPPYTDSKMGLTKQIMKLGHLQNEDLKMGIAGIVLLIIFFVFVLPALN